MKQTRAINQLQPSIKPTTVLLRTTPTRTINQLQTSVTTNNSPSQDCTNLDDRAATNVSHNQQQSFSGPHKPGRSTNNKQKLIYNVNQLFDVCAGSPTIFSFSIKNMRDCLVTTFGYIQVGMLKNYFSLSNQEYWLYPAGNVKELLFAFKPRVLIVSS